MSDDYDSAVRRMLVGTVEGTRLVSAPSRRRTVATGILSFALAGALAGGAVSAFASGGVEEPPPPPSVTAADDTALPVDYPPADFGIRKLDYFGQSIAYVGAGPDTIAISPRPEGADTLAVSLQCLSAGEFQHNIDARAKDSRYGAGCDPENVDPNDPSLGTSQLVYDDVNGAAHVLNVWATDGATWRITITWAAQRPWAVNDRGQTYGQMQGFSFTTEDLPELLEYNGVTAAGEAVVGYVVSADLVGNSLLDPTERPTLPIFASDGRTRIGTTASE